MRAHWYRTVRSPTVTSGAASWVLALRVAALVKLWMLPSLLGATAPLPPPSPLALCLSRPSSLATALRSLTRAQCPPVATRTYLLLVGRPVRPHLMYRLAPVRMCLVSCMSCLLLVCRLSRVCCTRLVLHLSRLPWTPYSRPQESDVLKGLANSQLLAHLRL